MTANLIIEIWKSIIIGDNKIFVIFEHGTCVVITDVEKNPQVEATKIMSLFGPVYPGSPAGDFGIVKLSNIPGWVVTGHHQDMLNFVSPEEIDPKSFPIQEEADDYTIGILGRTKRDKDGKQPIIIHVEYKINENS